MTFDERTQRGIDLLADLWFPGSAHSPRMTELRWYTKLLDRAAAANDELAHRLREAATLADKTDKLTADEVETWPAEVVDGAFMFVLCTYYMSSEVRAAIGYPGQDRRPVATATVDQYRHDELIAPVLARGATYVPTPE